MAVKDALGLGFWFWYALGFRAQVLYGFRVLVSWVLHCKGFSLTCFYCSAMWSEGGYQRCSSSLRCFVCVCVCCSSVSFCLLLD